MELAFTRGLRDTIAPPRAAPVTVTLAPPAVMPPSVHASLVASTENAMIGTMQDFRIDVVEKNAEFEATIAALIARREEALARLVNVIAPARRARLADAQAGMDSAFRSLEAEVSLDTASRFASTVAMLDAPTGRIETVQSEESRFYSHHVPAVFERDCGEAVRAMEKSREELDMDKASTFVREKKTNARFELHCENFRRRGADEVADRTTQLNSLAKSFASDFAVLESSALAAEKRYPAALAVEAEAIKAEEIARAAGDSAFAENMTAALTRIKEIALSTYGDDEGDE